MEKILFYCAYFFIAGILLASCTAGEARGVVRREEDNDDHEEEDHTDHDHDDHEVEGNCYQEELLHEEFSELSVEMVVVGENTSDNYFQVCRSLILHLNLTSKCCLENGTHCEEEKEEEEEEEEGSSRTDPAKAYGFGFLMVILVSLGSLGGVLVVPLVRKNSKFGKLYKYVYALMVAMGASALFCDAILHLIPHAFGLHDHEHEGESDSHGHEEEEEEEHGIPGFIWKGVALVAGIYAFFLLEVVLHTWNDIHKHSHSLEDEDSDHKHHVQLTDRDVTVPHGSCVDKGGDTTASIAHPGDGKSRRWEEKCASEGSESSKRPIVEMFEVHGLKGYPKRCTCMQYILNIKPLAWLIILGDGIHNFADGLALGAAISQSLALGISTTIAIVFHEVPHEFGDYFILLSTGMSWYMALLFNFLSALTAVLGFFVGVAVGTESEDANNWILAIAAGIFLYIALVDLLPEVIHSKERGYSRWGLFVMANLGFYISFAVLLVIAVYEEELNTLVE